MESMGAKRRRKVKGGRYAAKAAAAALEEGQKILTRYKGSTEVNPLELRLAICQGGGRGG